VLIIVVGCAAGFAGFDQPQPLKRAEICLREGDWACVRVATANARQQLQGPQTTYAAYLQALAWVHPANPDQDLVKARDAFAHIVQSEPESPMGLTSRAWLAVIETQQQQELETQRLRQTTKCLREELGALQNRTMLIQKRLDQMKAVDLSVE
jgi:hypothetical protein